MGEDEEEDLDHFIQDVNDRLNFMRLALLYELLFSLLNPALTSCEGVSKTKHLISGHMNATFFYPVALFCAEN